MSTDLNTKEENDKNFHYLSWNILCSTSIILSFIFILMIKKKESNYARIVRHIVMSEGMSIFCFLGIIVRGEDHFIRYVRIFAKRFFNFLTFNLFKDFQKEDNQDFFNLMNVINLAMYYSMEAFSLTFSIFICLELILILKNPIAQMKSRFKPYFIFSLFLALIIFVMICTVKLPTQTTYLSVEDYFFYDNFQL